MAAPKLSYTREEVKALLDAVDQYHKDTLKEKAAAYAQAEKRLVDLAASSLRALDEAEKETDSLYSDFLDELTAQGYEWEWEPTSSADQFTFVASTEDIVAPEPSAALHRETEALFREIEDRDTSTFFFERLGSIAAGVL